MPSGYGYYLPRGCTHYKNINIWLIAHKYKKKIGDMPGHVFVRQCDLAAIAGPEKQVVNVKRTSKGAAARV